MTARTKNILIYVAVALGGLFLGWLLFADKSPDVKDAATTEEAGQATEYTCSMHPQIRQNEPGNCPICGMELIPVSKTSGSAAAADPYLLEMSPEAVALANIQTTVAGQAGAANELQLSGKVEVNEQKVSSVTAKFPGRVERLFVDFTGQPVRKGQRVASLYSPELVAAQRELQEAAKNKNLIPELYEAARNKLRLWKLSDRQIQQIEQAEKLLTSFDIYADVSGVVTQKLVSVGDYVNTGSVLFEVANLNEVWVVLDAYETDLSQIKKGSAVSFTVPAAPGQAFTGKVAFITPVLEAATRAVEVRVEVENKNNLLKPGMLVNARVEGPKNGSAQALAIPKTAVLWTGKRSVVYVKEPNREQPAFEMREVVLGPAVGENYIIQSGLRKGEAVVTNGVFAVDAAAQLTGNYSMMTTPPENAVALPAEFQKQFSALEEQYYNLKNKLVASDKSGAAKAADQFLKVLDAVDMTLLKGDAHNTWMKLQPGLKRYGLEVKNSGSLAAQRQAFTSLSDLMISAVEVFGTQQQTVYKQYCPMVNDDAGAFWLSQEKDIKNPYYGQDMLSCGETRKTYRKGKAEKAKSEAKPAQPQVHQH